MQTSGIGALSVREVWRMPSLSIRPGWPLGCRSEWLYYAWGSDHVPAIDRVPISTVLPLGIHWWSLAWLTLLSQIENLHTNNPNKSQFKWILKKVTSSTRNTNMNISIQNKNHFRFWNNLSFSFLFWTILKIRKNVFRTIYRATNRNQFRGSELFHDLFTIHIICANWSEVSYQMKIIPFHQLDAHSAQQEKHSLVMSLALL